MARRLVQYIEFTDDFDRESPADETLEVALDGTVYEIDCASARAKELRDFLAPYAEVAHDKWKMPARPGAKKRLTVQQSLAEAVTAKPKPVSEHSERLRDKRARTRIRDWAEVNGLPCTRTGKIPIETLQAYIESNPDAYVPATTLGDAGLEMPNA